MLLATRLTLEFLWRWLSPRDLLAEPYYRSTGGQHFAKLCMRVSSPSSCEPSNAPTSDHTREPDGPRHSEFHPVPEAFIMQLFIRVFWISLRLTFLSLTSYYLFALFLPNNGYNTSRESYLRPWLYVALQVTWDAIEYFGLVSRVYEASLQCIGLYHLGKKQGQKRNERQKQRKKQYNRKLRAANRKAARENIMSGLH